MASEEERARIMAEYLAENNTGEEEEEFQEDDDDEDDDEYEKGGAQKVNCPVLQGRLKLNDEQHLVYLGTWCMKVDLGKGERNKKTTFKLKSIEPMAKTFNLAEPPTLQKLKMNGFFHTDDTDQIEPHRKIKEKGVVLEFVKEAGKSYQVKGEGTNEFGMFALKGTYLPNPDKKTFWLQCEKYYGGIPEEDSDEIDSEDDQKDPQELDDLQDDAGLTVEELQQKYYGGANVPSPPKAKASSSRNKAEREGRRKKRNGETAAEEDSKPAAKKPKTDEEEDDGDLKPKAKPSPAKKQVVVAADEDDDDDCGF